MKIVLFIICLTNITMLRTYGTTPTKSTTTTMSTNTTTTTSESEAVPSRYLITRP